MQNNDFAGLKQVRDAKLRGKLAKNLTSSSVIVI